jgi:ABC-type lipoprotein export system ATPase subunit
VTHDPTVADAAGRVIQMLDGRVETDTSRPLAAEVSSL